MDVRKLTALHGTKRELFRRFKVAKNKVCQIEERLPLFKSGSPTFLILRFPYCLMYTACLKKDSWQKQQPV